MNIRDVYLPGLKPKPKPAPAAPSPELQAMRKRHSFCVETVGRFWSHCDYKNGRCQRCGGTAQLEKLT